MCAFRLRRAAYFTESEGMRINPKLFSGIAQASSLNLSYIAHTRQARSRDHVCTRRTHPWSVQSELRASQHLSHAATAARPRRVGSHSVTGGPIMDQMTVSHHRMTPMREVWDARMPARRPHRYACGLRSLAMPCYALQKSEGSPARRLAQVGSQKRKSFVTRAWSMATGDQIEHGLSKI